MGLGQKKPEQLVKPEWKSSLVYEVTDHTGRVCYRSAQEWPIISPRKVSLQEDLLGEAQMKFKQMASSA